MSIDPKTFQFIKEEDDSSLYPVDPEYYERYLSLLPAGTYEIRIKPWATSRSLRQNRAFHGPVLDQLCDVTGYERHEMKRELKRLFSPKTHYIGVDGEVQEIYKGTSQMTVGEFAEFLDKIIRWTASTFGFTIKIDSDLRDPSLPN